MKNRIFAVVFSSSLFFSFLGFAGDFSDYVVAKVNNKAIANSEVLDRYRFVTLTSKINTKNENEKKILRQQVIDKMVDEELIRQEAKELKIEIGEKELQEGIDLVSAHYKKNPAQLKAFLRQNNLSFEIYSKQVEAEILWSKIIVETLRPKIKISDVEVNEFFEQHKFNTDVRKFFLSEILIAPSENAAKFAEKLVLELRNGANFEALSEQFSSGVGGEIGWVSQNDLDRKIYAAISGLKKGGYSDPVSLANGYHIFKLVDSKTETKIADKDLSAAKNIIFSQKLQTLAKGRLMDMRKRAFIEIKNN
jgi:peptidyl-prolyl cis-trans isomerase SurA